MGASRGYLQVQPGKMCGNFLLEFEKNAFACGGQFGSFSLSG